MADNPPTGPDVVTRTKEALADPKPGDRFQEMYSYWIVVVTADDWGVSVLHAGGPFNLERGRVRNDARREYGKPYQEWVTVEPWQQRAGLRHFPTLAGFQKYVNGDLLCDRGLDVSGWPAERAGSVRMPAGMPVGKEGEDA